MKYEEFKNTLIDTSLGNKSATKKLYKYFTNKPIVTDEEELQKRKFEAFQFFSEAIKTEKNSNSYYFLGTMYENGWSMETNFQEAAKCYAVSAENNNDSAKNDLGYLYLTGLGVDKNYNTAKKWFSEAAKQGNNAAQFHLGTIYAEGYGVEKNLVEAKKWYHAAAEKSIKQAQHELGVIYLKEKKYVEAEKWLKLSAENDLTLAQNLLGSLYCENPAFPNNYRAAFRLYLSAAKQSDVEGLGRLGNAYETGIDGTACVKDIYQAIICYVLALKLDESYQFAIARLNDLQEHGFSEAIAFARKSDLVISAYKKELTKLPLMQPEEFHAWIETLSWEVQQKAPGLNSESTFGEMMKLILLTAKSLADNKQKENDNLTIKFKQSQRSNQELQNTIKKLQEENKQLIKQKSPEIKSQEKKSQETKTSVTKLIDKQGSWQAPVPVPTNPDSPVIKPEENPQVKQDPDIPQLTG